MLKYDYIYLTEVEHKALCRDQGWSARIFPCAAARWVELLDPLLSVTCIGSGIQTSSISNTQYRAVVFFVQYLFLPIQVVYARLVEIDYEMLLVCPNPAVLIYEDLNVVAESIRRQLNG